MTKRVKQYFNDVWFFISNMPTVFKYLLIESAKQREILRFNVAYQQALDSDPARERRRNGYTFPKNDYQHIEVFRNAGPKLAEIINALKALPENNSGSLTDKEKDILLQYMEAIKVGNTLVQANKPEYEKEIEEIEGWSWGKRI